MNEEKNMERKDLVLIESRLVTGGSTVVASGKHTWACGM